MRDSLTPKQVAQAIGVSESSLKRWCDRGLLAMERTAGGHRRLNLDAVVQFLRESGHKPVRPELLGLPAATGQGLTIVSRARDQFCAALLAGDEEQCRRIVFDVYLSGQSACDVCDHLLAGAFHQIGHQWECGELAVYRERQACEVARRVMYELGQAIPHPAGAAPLAFGGTLEHDPYQLPTAMVEIVLREQGWQAHSYGTLLPASTLAQAVLDHRPRLLWVSVSALQSREALWQDCAQLHEVTASVGAAFVVGGRALSEEVRQGMNYSAYCDTLRHLQSFVRTIGPNAQTAAPASK